MFVVNHSAHKPSELKGELAVQHLRPFIVKTVFERSAELYVTAKEDYFIFTYKSNPAVEPQQGSKRAACC